MAFQLYLLPDIPESVRSRQRNLQEAVDEADEEEEAPFECPDGYTAVKLAGRWVCQKTETSTVGRPTIGTRPYLSKVGFAGPSPYPPSTRTVTRTVTAAE